MAYVILGALLLGAITLAWRYGSKSATLKEQLKGERQFNAAQAKLIHAFKRVVEREPKFDQIAKDISDARTPADLARVHSKILSLSRGGDSE